MSASDRSSHNTTGQSAINDTDSESVTTPVKNWGRYHFPNPIDVDPDGVGVIAIGGDLAPETLLSAYAQGLFPWFNENDPIAWWCPEPRCVMVPEAYQPSKSLRKQARNSRWQLTLNQAFNEVIQACSLPRYDSFSGEQPESEHTWIHDAMIKAYNKLHRYGFAHSIEVWDEGGPEHGQLIGGLYGLKIGQIYFGESMFHSASNASKLAFWGLMRLCHQSQIQLVDCQLPNDHLLSLGATPLPRREFLEQLNTLVDKNTATWQYNSHKPLAVAALDNLQPWQLQL